MGGRGSGKTRSFRQNVGGMHGQRPGGAESCGRQFMNSLADSSLEEIKAGYRVRSLGIAAHFRDRREIRPHPRRQCALRIYRPDRKHRQRVKSKARVLLCWVDEAENVIEEGPN